MHYNLVSSLESRVLKRSLDRSAAINFQHVRSGQRRNSLNIGDLILPDSGSHAQIAAKWFQIDCSGPVWLTDGIYLRKLDHLAC